MKCSKKIVCIVGLILVLSLTILPNITLSAIDQMSSHRTEGGERNAVTTTYGTSYYDADNLEDLFGRYTNKYPYSYVDGVLTLDGDYHYDTYNCCNYICVVVTKTSTDTVVDTYRVLSKY